MSFWQKKDVRIFLILIPAIKLVNMFVTYSELEYNWALLLAFTMDVMQGYFTWLATRFVIIKMEKRQPDKSLTLFFFIKQVFFTYIVAFITIIIFSDGSWLITGKRYAESTDDHLVHDLVIFFIWIVIGNFVYLLLRYSAIWKASEAKLQDEQKLKTEGITIKIGDVNVKIPLKDIRGFYVEDGSTYIINANFRTFLVDSSLDNLELKLPERYFFRVNRKFILHRSSILSFKRIEDNKLMLATINEKPFPAEIPMSRLKAPAFKKWFGEDSTLL